MPDAESVYLFRHALVRDAAYGLFPPAARVDLHRSAIGSFEKLFEGGLDIHAEELLQHARAGLAQQEGDSESLREAEYRYLSMAADFCAQGWRVADECRYLSQLEDHPLATDPERAAFMLRRAAHLRESGRLDLADTLADKAAHIADGETRWKALFTRFMARHDAGRANSLRELDELLHLLSDARPSSTLVSVQIAKAMSHGRSGEHDKADTMFDRAVQSARTVGQPESEAEALFERGLAYHRVGRSEEGFASVNEALEIAREIGNKKLEMNALNRLGIIYVETGRLDEAAASYKAAIEIAHAIGAKSTKATVSNNYANLQFYFFGNLSVAERRYRESLEFFREHNDVSSAAHANGVLGLIYHASGEYENGRRRFEVVRELAIKREDRVMEAKAYMGMAFCSDSQKDVRTVMADYTAALERLRAAPSGANLSRTWGNMANQLLQRGYVAAAGEALRVAASQLAVEGFRAEIIPRYLRRYDLLVGNRDQVDADKLVAESDSYPLDRISYALTDLFIYEAGRGASQSRLRELGDEITKSCADFEALRYERVRFALRLVDATLNATTEEQKWRGLPLTGLPAGLANALSNSGAPNPALRELLPGLQRLAQPLPVN